MPWCDSCDVYLAPNSVSADGSCPTCESIVDAADTKAATAPITSVPWHFWLLVVAVVGYLGWRVLQGAGWLVERF